MNIDLLRYFIAVAEYGSISRAAVHLQIAQPALSRHVRKLEADLGGRLLTRYGRGVALTRAGEQFLEHARTIIEHADMAVRETAALGERPVGEITVGMPPSAAEMLAAPLALQVARELPSIRLRVQEAFGGHLMEDLLAGGIDLGVFYSPSPSRALVNEPILEEELVLVGVGSAMVGKKPKEISDLQRLPLALPTERQNLRRTIERAAIRSGAQLNVVLELDTLRGMKQVAASGELFTILSRNTIRDELDTGALLARSIAPRLSRTLCLTTARARPLAEGARVTASILRQSIQSLVRNGGWIAQLLS